MVRVEKVVLGHELYTSSASCFCSACRRRDYNKSFTNSMYPGQAPVLKADGIEETVVRVTGVDPVVGVSAVPGNFSRKKPRAIVFGKEDFCMMKRVPDTQFGDSFCNST